MSEGTEKECDRKKNEMKILASISEEREEQESGVGAKRVTDYICSLHQICNCFRLSRGLKYSLC